MLQVALLACLVSLASGDCAASAVYCTTGGWSPWSECRQPEVSPGVSRDVMGVTKEIDDGRVAMSELIEKKLHDYARSKDRSPASMVEGRVNCEDGFAGIYPCQNVDQLSFLSMEDLEPSGQNYFVSDMWGYTDAEDGEEYAIVGLDRGSTFIRVTDPESPEILGFLFSTDMGSEIWRDMKVIGTHVYIVSEFAEHGMQVFDLTQLRGLTADNTRVFEPSAFYDGVSNTHNIVANPESNTVFLVGSWRQPSSGGTVCGGGLHMVDVSDPLNPTFAGCFGGDGYVHDAQCVNYAGPDTRYHGREVCFCYNEDTFTIVDVTDKANATIISRSEYDGYAYTHQGWCTEDFTIALLDDELDENRATEDRRTRTYMWDVVDLEAPELKNIHYHINEAIDHNQYVLGEYTYQSNYMSGLRVLWIDQPNYDLVEVAHFDVYPSSTTADFGGSWSNYPYFKSGAVGVTSSEYGFYMLSVHLPETTPPQPAGQQARFRRLMEINDRDACPALEQFRDC